MRLKELRKEKGLSLKDVAEILGVAESTVSLYENTKRELSYTALQRLAKFFGVSIDYLLGFNDEDSQTQSNPYLVHIPILESVSISESEIECLYSAEDESIELGSDEDYFYYKMHGDSMAPHISNGDIALIKKQNELESGKVAAVIYENNPVLLRKIITKGDITILQPLNSDFDSFFVKNSDEVTILGIVTQTIKKW